MIILRKTDERGNADLGWLRTHYSFSFADYYDPEHIHFGFLRVLNDDIIEAARGFDWHRHENMEIVTIPLRGSVFHRDSMGNETVVKTGEVQIMSAGSGVVHSEYNASSSEILELLQIWIIPNVKNVQPSYDQKVFEVEKRKNTWQKLISPKADEGSLFIHQDVEFFRASVSEEMVFDGVLPGYGAYVFVIDGKGSIEGGRLEKRDAIMLTEMTSFRIIPDEEMDILIITTIL